MAVYEVVTATPGVLPGSCYPTSQKWRRPS